MRAERERVGAVGAADLRQVACSLVTCFPGRVNLNADRHTQTQIALQCGGSTAPEQKHRSQN